MPKTKVQSFIFTIIMVFCMVYCMTTYSIALSAGELTYNVFYLALKEMWIEYIIVFLLIFFIITKLAQRLSLRIISPEEDKPIFMILAMQSFTVVFIVPVITLIATFLHNGFTANWFVQWVTTAVICFPMAYFLQIFFVGPFVRMIFRMIFRNHVLEN
ncbi:MAG: DUF2798 domain-containing protein [Candidatus Ornithomonoglobus sp.]